MYINISDGSLETLKYAFEKKLNITAISADHRKLLKCNGIYVWESEKYKTLVKLYGSDFGNQKTTDTLNNVEPLPNEIVQYIESQLQKEAKRKEEAFMKGEKVTTPFSQKSTKAPQATISKETDEKIEKLSDAVQKQGQALEMMMQQMMKMMQPKSEEES